MNSRDSCKTSTLPVPSTTRLEVETELELGLYQVPLPVLSKTRLEVEDELKLGVLDVRI